MRFAPVARAALFGVAATAAALPAASQTYPNRPIRFLIPYAVGGSTDILGRIVGAKLAERIGQQVVVDNRPGASAIIATEILARSAPDGYTIMTANIAHAANPYLTKKLPYDTVKDFVPVTLMAVLPTVLVIHPGVAARSVKDFVALARSKPGQMSYGTAGIGTANHLPMELFKVTAKLDIIHVPYKGGGPAMTDLVGGQVQCMFITIPPVLSQVKAGKLVALGISSAKRSNALPDVPTIAEAGLPGFEGYEWQGVIVPRATPQSVVDRLNKEIVGVLGLPDVRERAAVLGAEVVAGTGAEFGEYIRKELALWGRVIREAGIRPE